MLDEMHMQYTPRGLLRVAAPLTLSLTLLSPAIPKFLERYPHLSLDLRLDDRRINIVEEGIDAAIRVSRHLEDSSLIAKKLINLRYVVCCAPCRALRRADNAQRPATAELRSIHAIGSH
jgi:DNA-binding transcriptional LysR family regulator